MNTTNGKIAEQSKKMIANALLMLMEKENYKDITITQISQEADLSRKTFYRLFSDKEMVLQHLLEQKAISFIRNIKEESVQDYWDIMMKLFDFWKTEKEFLQLLKKQSLLYMVNQTVYQYAVEVFYSVRAEPVIKEYEDNLPYLLSYSIGGMCSMLQKWIEDDMIVEPHVFVEKLHGAFGLMNI